MNMIRRTQIILATSAAAFALVACGQTDDTTTVGQKIDGALAQTEQAAVNTQQDIQSAATDLQREGEKAVVAATDSATDLAITAKVKAALAADDELSAVGINVDTQDTVVSLQGPAPTEAAAERATELAKAVDGVTEVKNMLSIAGQG